MKRDLAELIRLLALAPYSLNGRAPSALEALSQRERDVLELRYGLKDGAIYSLQAVGDMYGVSGERIRQIEARALGKLRRRARAQPLPVTSQTQPA